MSKIIDQDLYPELKHVADTIYTALTDTLLLELNKMNSLNTPDTSSEVHTQQINGICNGLVHFTASAFSRLLYGILILKEGYLANCMYNKHEEEQEFIAGLLLHICEKFHADMTGFRNLSRH